MTSNLFLNHTTKLNLNGNRWGRVSILALEQEWIKFSKPSNGDISKSELDFILKQLKLRFGYRIYKNSKIEPYVSWQYEDNPSFKADIMDVFVELKTEGNIKYSRQRYMYATKHNDHYINHHDYCAQFAQGVAFLKDQLQEIRKSRCKHFNDTSLTNQPAFINALYVRWHQIAESTTYGNYNAGGISLSSLVSISKAAAALHVTYMVDMQRESKITEIDKYLAVREYPEYPEGFEFYDHVMGNYLSTEEAYLAWKAIRHRPDTSFEAFKKYAAESVYGTEAYKKLMQLRLEKPE